MKDRVSLILILHNRHRNIDRLLEYYKDFSSSIIIADSSNNKYNLSASGSNIKHIYTPHVSYTSKIESVLNIVETPYVVMCADDDFIIESSIYKCIDFLNANEDFSAAQGIAIQYLKDSITSKTINYELLYMNMGYDFEDKDPLIRLERFLSNYRSILYAVHRTSLLKLAYKNAGSVIKNLYLNEYLSCIVPVIVGKCKQLPILYQVREFSESSDDKITPNLDKIYYDTAFEKEREEFIDVVVNNAKVICGLDAKAVKENISILLSKFSKSPLIGENEREISFKKRIGAVIQNIPFIGRWLISLNRKLEKKKENKIIFKSEWKKDVNEINKLLKKYAS